MTIKNKEGYGKSKKFSISKLLYVIAAIVALLGIAILADDIFLFRTTVAQYAMQGYPAAEVMKQLVPAQLLPGIFEALALYGGMAFALVGIGTANKKLSDHMAAVNFEFEEGEEIYWPEEEELIEAESEKEEEEAQEENQNLKEETEVKEF
ncbi:hypothetical protein [Aminipila luticellarii]|uniref:hypothetical protein n=1 Tax=Aminipila luticellarii TaxID=2507160 RepID=UPI00196B9C4F|nr:hypothetical protein [Aminipila luticellarii]